MADNSLYFDYAAATPLDDEVLVAMQPFFNELFYNPSASYDGAKLVRQAIETARADIAHWLGARPAEIVFTAGGTEANNLAIRGVMDQYPQANVVVSAVEHESVLEPALGYDHRLAAVRPDGRLDLDSLRRQIDDKTVLVSIMYANNEVGTIQPLREVGVLLEKIRKERRASGNQLPLYFHSDACQAGNCLDLHLNRLTLNMLSINGGKLYGPKQSGVLYVKSGTRLQALVRGGGQERNLRSGTENVAAIVGLAVALRQAQEQRQEESRRLQELQRHFFVLLETRLPQAVINGSRKYRLPGNVHLTLPGHDNERLLFALDEFGIQAAAGSACNASNEVPSHVLKAMGLSDAEARASLRLTMGRFTDMPAVETVIRELQRLTIA